MAITGGQSGKNMKKFYFVRHGESDSNKNLITQGPLGSLTEEGLEQGRLIAERFKKIEIDEIVSSSMQRAKETAGIIASALNKKILFTDLLIERRKPSATFGLSLKSKEYKEIMKFVYDGYRSGEPYSDEESIEELRIRAKMAIEYLFQVSGDSILILTHGIFLRVILVYLVFGEKFSVEEFLKVSSFFQMSNTGITIFTYDEGAEPWEKWKLVTWNDHAHLG